MEKQVLELTLEGVKEKAREFYDKGMLTAQHPDKDLRQCTNKMLGGYRCAVAASYPDWLLTGGGAPTLEAGIENGYITVEKIHDIGRIARIQLAHDLWAQASRQGLAYEESMKNLFLISIK